MDEGVLQTAVVQAGVADSYDTLPLVVSPVASLPDLSSSYHVLVHVVAVALNPTDYKNPMFLPAPGQPIGCDFCGIVTRCGEASVIEMGPRTRVCGAVFPYGHPGSPDAQTPMHASGAFSEWVVADSRLLIKVPPSWNDLQGAALGGIGWGTVALALSDNNALALEGFPSAPADTARPVVVYGGATATGTTACQLLRLSGYKVIAITSPQSASLALQYSASKTVRALAGSPIRHVLDCITSPESAAISFSAIARTGGRYACLEALNENWRTRKLVHVKEVMGFEGLGLSAQLGTASSTYTRSASTDRFLICQRWRGEIQKLVDTGMLKTHPVREIPGSRGGIIHGLGMLKNGEVRGQKLVVRIAPAPVGLE
ncbi:putative zinc binding dehydrogenase [Nemania sp. FL0916]|nr:putative zinc binding dehydrogenase [Nemania sp. FL0916]